MDDNTSSNRIVVVSGSGCFKPKERKELEEALEENNLSLIFLEHRSIQGSVFDGIEIILNNNLFNMIVGGLIMPAAYDTLKTSLTLIIKKIKHSEIKILRANKKPEPANVVIKIKTDAGEIIASINRVLSETEIEKYMQALIEAYKIADSPEGSTKQYYIIDTNSDDTLEILTFMDYLKKHKKI